MSPTVALVRSAESPAPPAPLDERVIAAALSCIARWGVAKTSLDDVARQARCGRATVYRAFPGGKEALVRAVARAEAARVASVVAERLEQAATLEDLLVAGLFEAARQIAGHAALAYLVEHEPETVVPWLAFEHGDEFLAFATDVAAPQLVRFLPPAEARRAAEWTARVLLSFLVCPAPGFDLSDEDSARALVTTFLLPGLVPDR